MQRRNLVVEDIALLVESPVASLEHGVDCPGRQGRAAIYLLAQSGGQLKQVVSAARIAIRRIRETLDQFRRRLESRLPESALGIFQRAMQQLRDVVGIQRFEHVRSGTRQQRIVQGEGRVLGGGADEDQSPVLDEGQEGVLLGLVEAVHFIEEEDCRTAAAGTDHARLIDGRADILDTGKHRGKRDELGVGGRGDQPSQGRLAGTRRSPQDQRMQPAALEQRPQRLAPSEHMGLTDHLGQVPRPHPVG